MNFVLVVYVVMVASVKVRRTTVTKYCVFMIKFDIHVDIFLGIYLLHQFLLLKINFNDLMSLKKVYTGVRVVSELLEILWDSILAAANHHFIDCNGTVSRNSC